MMEVAVFFIALVSIVSMLIMGKLLIDRDMYAQHREDEHKKQIDHLINEHQRYLWDLFLQARQEREALEQKLMAFLDPVKYATYQGNKDESQVTGEVGYVGDEEPLQPHQPVQPIGEE